MGSRRYVACWLRRPAMFVQADSWTGQKRIDGTRASRCRRV